jgi:SdpC family antimicrobial peptide
VIVEIHRQLRRCPWGVLACTLFLTGCHDGVSVPTESTPPIPDGVAFYRGLLQGEGRVADEVDELRRSAELTRLMADPEVRARSLELQERLVADIRDTDPGFFDRLGADMTSGDHLRIRSALVEAREVTAAVALSWPESQEAMDALRDDPALLEEAMAAAHELVPEAQRVDADAMATLLGDDPVRDRIRLLTQGGGPSEERILAGAVFAVAVAVLHWFAGGINVVAAMNLAFAVNVAVVTWCAIAIHTDCAEGQRTIHDDRLVAAIAERYPRAGDAAIAVAGDRGDHE